MPVKQGWASDKQGDDFLPADFVQDTLRIYYKSELVDGLNWRFIADANVAQFATIIDVERSAKDLLRWQRMFDRFMIKVVKKPQRSLDVALTKTIDKEVSNAETVAFSFWGSSPSANVVHVIYQEVRPPHKIIWQKTFQLSKEDHLYEAIEKIPPCLPGDYSLTFALGEDTGNIDLTHISLREQTSTVPSSLSRELIAEHVGRVQSRMRTESKLYTPEEIENRIKLNRCGVLTILVTDKGRQPVRGAQVEVSQLRHDFLFGCNLDNLTLADHSAWQHNYQERFSALFNYARLPCYWNAIESKPGTRDFSKIDAMAAWCKVHHITCNGYGLISPYHCPAWTAKDFHVAVGRLRATMIECIKHYGDRIQLWDVVDDMMDAQFFPPTNIMAQWLNQDKSVGVIERALLWAKAAAGEHKLTLIVNESRASFYPTLKTHNILPDAIGLTLGMQAQLVPTKAIWKFCQDGSSFDKDIHVTELAILSGECRPNANKLKAYPDWVSTKDGENRQADSIVTYYSLLFSHPQVVGISWRDLSDKGAWMGAPGGLLRCDGTPKPAYNRLMQLIHKQWWTNVSGLTDNSGAFRPQAYFGDYKVTVRDNLGHVIRKFISFTPATQRESHIITVGN